MTRKKKLIWSSIAVLAVLGLIIAKAKSGRNQNGTETLPTPVAVAAVSRETIPITVTAPGNLLASNTVTVHSRVDGQLVRIVFNEGQFVQKNQILAQIDPRPFDAALQQATANLHNAEAQLVKAKADWSRAIDLSQQGFMSQQNLEAAALLVHQLEATIELNNAAIDAAKIQRDYCEIRAPIAGRTGIRQMDAGNIIRAGDATGLVVITQSQPIAVIFNLTEPQLTQLVARMKREQGQATAPKGGLTNSADILPRLARPLAVTAWDKSGSIKLGEGRVTLIDNMIDSVTGTIKLKAEFANQDNLLWPGQYITIRMVIDNLTDVLSVPDQAVQQGSDGPYVFVVTKAAADAADATQPAEESGGFWRMLPWNHASQEAESPPMPAASLVAKQRPVTVAWRENGRAVLSRGLALGETIVTEGQYRLRDGSRIAIQATGDKDKVQHQSGQ
ncbi:MAG: efflux RND transporter periplasmic adaptor subunit [Candidatus Symbiobacter sp.]|nr:efflux RND transporter periplasmic adaptor subunit [Candidatus Symbiobacter sp.]